MAKVAYIDLTTEEEIPYYGVLNAQSRFSFARVARKVTLLSKNRVAGITNRSILPQVASVWNSLTSGQKTDWTTAGAQRGLNGYRLFVQDQSLRIKNGLPGSATPSILHQSYVGNLHIEAPATNIKIVQLHPHSYWISRKVSGKKGMYEPVLITEDVVLPLVLSLNYKADLVSTGPAPSARFYVKVWHSYQGNDLYHYLEIPLDLSCSWKNATATLSTLVSYVVGYDLYIELVNVQGDLYIDNVKSTHSEQNWVRDTYCQDIDQSFTKAFYQIPKHWAVIDVPEGAWYNSIYKDF